MDWLEQVRTMKRMGRYRVLLPLYALLMTMALGVGIGLSTAATSVQLMPEDVISRLAGTGARTFSGDGGAALDAGINLPRDTAIGPDGSLYVADTYNHRIRRIDPGGQITTIAGNGSTSYNGDGIPAVQASLYWPHDVTVDDDGTVYIADSAHHRVRSIDPQTGFISTVFGTGASGKTGDGGLGTQARLKNPKSVALFDGGLYVSDLSHRVRRLDLDTGLVVTVAGTGTAGYSGDGGSAVAAQLNGPQRIALDSAGNLFIADARNNAVRRVDGEAGVITTIAGTGVAGYSGDGGPGTAARLQRPRGVAWDGGSTIYIADSNNHRIRALDLETGIIITLAGSSAGYGGDGGPAADARLRNPRGLTVDAEGRLIIADTFNSRIRVIAPAVP